MDENRKVIDDAVKRCTRAALPDGLIPINTGLRDELGMDSIGLLMLFDMLGQRLQLDPVQLSRRSARLLTMGDLVDAVEALSRD